MSQVERYGMATPPFSAAMGSETLLFVSGQGGIDRETKEIVGDDVESQTIQTIRNVEAILVDHDLTLQDVMKVNVYLKNREDYAAFNQVYAKLFAEPYPARTLVYCDLNFDILVEIDVIALKKSVKK